MESAIAKHKELLIDLMDPDFGLLDHLLANGHLLKRTYDTIKLSPSTIQDRCERLISYILENNKVQEMLSALENNNQAHLVNYIRADGNYNSEFNEDWPLGENEMKRMTVNRPRLIEIIDDQDLCLHLLSHEIINTRQHNFISSKSNKSERNEALLEFMHRFSVKQFWVCITCLRESHQNHVAEILSKSGVVVEVHANLQGASPNVNEQEETIVSGITNMLENSHVSSEEWSRISSLIELRLLAAHRGQSVLLYFHCLSFEELQRLVKMMHSGSLKRTVENVFTQLLYSKVIIAVSLTWSEGDVERSMMYFSADQNKAQPQTIAKVNPLPPMLPPMLPKRPQVTGKLATKPVPDVLDECIVNAATWTGTVEESTELMKSMKEDGVFMIRESTTGNGDQTLQVYCNSDKTVRKYKVLNDGKTFRMIDGSTFNSMAELLNFYQKNSISEQGTKLTKPYSMVNKADV